MLISFYPIEEGQVFILLDWVSGAMRHEGGAFRKTPWVHPWRHPVVLFQLFLSAVRAPRGLSFVAHGLLRACPGLHICCSDFGRCPCLARALMLEEPESYLGGHMTRHFTAGAIFFFSFPFCDSSVLAEA